MLALRESAEDPAREITSMCELWANEDGGKPAASGDCDGNDGSTPPKPSVAPPTGFTESGIIDVTDTFDGMPIDISSPHLNVGEHKEALYQAAALAREEEAKAAYEEAERIEAAKEALLEEALSEEAERQFYEQQLHNQYHLAQADAMQQHYEEEEAAFQAEQMLRQEKYLREQQEQECPLSPPPGNANDEEQRQQQYWKQQQQWLEDNENETSVAPPLGAFSPEPPGPGVSMPDVLADPAGATIAAAAIEVSPSAVSCPLNASVGSANQLLGVDDSADLDNVLRQPVALDFDRISVAENDNVGDDIEDERGAHEDQHVAITDDQFSAEECKEEIKNVEVYVEDEREEETEAEALEEELSAPIHHSPPLSRPCSDETAEEIDDTVAEVVHADAHSNSLQGRSSSPEQLDEIVEDHVDDEGSARVAAMDTDRDTFDAISPSLHASEVTLSREAKSVATKEEVAPSEAATPPVKRLLNRIVGHDARSSVGNPPDMPTPPPAAEVLQDAEQPSPPLPSSSSSSSNEATPTESPVSPPVHAPPSTQRAVSSLAQDEVAAPKPDLRKVQLLATSRIPRLRTRPFAVWEQVSSSTGFPLSSSSSSLSPRSSSATASGKKSGVVHDSSVDSSSSNTSGGDGFLSAFLLAAGVAPAQAVRATAALRNAGLSDHKSHDTSKGIPTTNATATSAAAATATTSSDAKSVFGVPGSAQRTKAAGVLRSAGAKASALKAVFALVDKLTTQEDDLAAAAVFASGPGEALNAARRNAAVKPVTAAAAPATAAPTAVPPAPALSAVPVVADEMRIDPADGEAYTKQEFAEEYGANCVEWDSAKPAAPRQVLHATVPPGPEVNTPGEATTSNSATAAGAGVKPAGGEKRSKSLVVRKPRDDPTAWADKRRIKTEKAKELREVKRFGM